jgi:hypothetical protein
LSDNRVKQTDGDEPLDGSAVFLKLLFIVVFGVMGIAIGLAWERGLPPPSPTGETVPSFRFLTYGFCGGVVGFVVGALVPLGRVFGARE